MKWVKFKEDFGKDGYLFKYAKPEKQYIKDTCFETVEENQEEFEELRLYKDDGSQKKGSNQFHSWICQKVPDEYLDPKYFDPRYYDKKSPNKDNTTYTEVKPHPYEIFIGGWLHFYDSEVQNGNSDYAVYFDWDFINKYVIVYIYQLKRDVKRWSVNVNVNPPASSDPPPPKIPPPYC